MSPRSWAALVAFGILGLGLGRILSTMRRRIQERREVEAFIDVFARYQESEGRDLRAYSHLLERSSRIQNLLGPVAVMDLFVAPFKPRRLLNHQCPPPKMNQICSKGLRNYRKPTAIGDCQRRSREKDRVGESDYMAAGRRRAVLLLPVQLLHS